MIVVRKTSTRTVFSSSWSRRKQVEMLEEWQIMGSLKAADFKELCEERAAH